MYYFALKAVKPDLQGILILDGDNRNLPEHELITKGLVIWRWQRYEAESYLIHPQALARFIRGTSPDLFSNAAAEKGLEYLRNQLPPAVFNDPLAEHEYFNVTPASKTLLPGFFGAAAVNLSKNEYYQVVAQMVPEEIPGEVKDKLDLICSVFKLT